MGAGTSPPPLAETELIRAARQAASVDETAHRPWPLPTRPWLAAQTREDVLLAHWPVDAGSLGALLPAGLELDRFDGDAYVGLVASRVSGLRLRGTLPFPGASSFVELDLRTYVTAADRPGLWLLSLDASSRLAVEAARRAYRLPAFRAVATATARAGWTELSCARAGAGRPFVLEAGCRAVGAESAVRPGTLEAFLVERYRIYAADGRGGLLGADLHHAPGRLRRAEATIELNTMAPAGIELAGEPPLLHAAARRDVLAWSAERLA